MYTLEEIVAEMKDEYGFYKGLKLTGHDDSHVYMNLTDTDFKIEKSSGKLFQCHQGTNDWGFNFTLFEDMEELEGLV